MVYSFVKEPKISYRGFERVAMDMPELKPVVVTVKLEGNDGDLMKRYAETLQIPVAHLARDIIKEWLSKR